ncbi:MAG: tRNA (guanosine(46)-N7)-methyltransferase TrmB, partial [Thermodesulfovibrionales bacterium]|nr:tRNA (guanosine(46)-N7)-methyltransferase TrmB [Thermodesulfovibrionales bacterium]
MGPPGLPPPTSRFRSRLKQKHKEALEKILPIVELPSDDLLSFEKVFGRKAPVYLEIGFGNGEFLCNAALQNPEADFIGIEFFLTGVAKLLRRLTDYGRLDEPVVKNIRIITGDARIIIPSCIPENSLNGIFILFPDPWPKKRHHKRRLIRREFIELLYDRLKVNGLLIIATDSEDYA